MQWRIQDFGLGAPVWIGGASFDGGWPGLMAQTSVGENLK